MEKKIKTLHIENNDIHYVIIRKPVKNINIRVKSDGFVYISANNSISEKYIVDLLLSKKEFILSSLKEIESTLKNAYNFKSLNYLGKSYPLEIISDCAEKVEFCNDKFVIRTKYDANTAPENIQHIIKRWQADRCMEIYPNIYNEVYDDFIKHGYKVNQSLVTIKDMKSRWGSCNVRMNKLSINIRLIEYPLKCIYSVFYHEYMHYIHADHSAAFHKDLNAIFPEYEICHKILNKK